MGNTVGGIASGDDPVCHLLAREPDWINYIQLQWRSEKARHLDELGGLDRPTIARGSSFTAKLTFLGDTLQRQGNEYQELFLPNVQSTFAAKKAQDEAVVKPAFMLFTERRAQQRKKEEDGPDNGGRINYARERDPAYNNMPFKAPGAMLSPVKGSSPTLIMVAPWRMRVHAARRRVMLILRVVALLRRGKKVLQRHGRLDNLAFLIPGILGDGCSKFVDEQLKYAGVKSVALQYKAALDDALVRGDYESEAVFARPPSPMRTSKANGLPAVQGASRAAKPERAGWNGVPTKSTRSGLQLPSSSGGYGDGERSTTGSMGPGSRHRPVDASALLQAAQHSYGGGPASRQRRASSGAAHLGEAEREERGLLRVNSSAPRIAADATATSVSGPSKPRSGRGASLLGGAIPRSPEAPKEGGHTTTGLFPSLTKISSSRSEQEHTGPDKEREPSSASAAMLLTNLRHRSASDLQREASLRGRGASPEDAGSTAPSATGRILLKVSEGGTSMSGRRPAVLQRNYCYTMAEPEVPEAASIASTAATAAALIASRSAAGDLPTSPSRARQASVESLVSEVEAQAIKLAKSSQMLSMLLNRCNGQWAEAQSWSAAQPDVWPSSELQSLLGTEQLSIYKADVQRSMRNGQIAFMIHAGDDVMPIPMSASSGGASLSTGGSSRHLERESSLSIGGSSRHLEREASLGWAQGAVSGGGSYSTGGAASGGRISWDGRGRQQVLDLWTTDPWQIINTCRPGIMPHTEHISGLSLGGRAIAQLVLAISALAGQEAVGKLQLLLHLHEGQSLAVVKDLLAYGFYGLQRENVLLLVQPRNPGYLYSNEYSCFELDGEGQAATKRGLGRSTSLEGHTSPTEGSSSSAPGPGSGVSLGSGYSLLQMGWAGEAAVVDADGMLQPLQPSAFQVLASRQVEWLISRRARDLCLQSKDGILDCPMLAYQMALKDRAHANLLLEVMLMDSAAGARSLDSIVLRSSHVSTNGPVSSASQPPTPNGSSSLTNGVGGGSTMRREGHRLVEMRHAELSTPRMTEVLRAAHAEVSGARGVVAGVHRYLMHLPSLMGMASSASVFRPKLSQRAGLVHVVLDAADLTAHDKARVAAVTARHTPGVLNTADDLEHLIPLIQAQDVDLAFRQLLVSCQARTNAAPPVVVRSTSASRDKTPCQVVVVFIASNIVTQSAVNLASAIARPGRDALHLVTFVPSEMQRADGQALVSRYQAQVVKTMVETRADVVVRGPWGLLDCMEKYTSDVGATMVVMGSAQLTSNVFSYVVGSVTLAAVKYLKLPLLITTANSKNTERCASLRVMTLVEGHARGALEFVCDKLMSSARNDRLLLAQVQPTRHLTRQQQHNARRLLDNFQLLATGHQQPCSRAMVLEGALDKVLSPAVEEHQATILAIALPRGVQGLPTNLISTIRSCKGAVLIYRDPTGTSSTGEAEGNSNGQDGRGVAGSEVGISPGAGALGQ